MPQITPWDVADLIEDTLEAEGISLFNEDANDGTLQDATTSIGMEHSAFVMDEDHESLEFLSITMDNGQRFKIIIQEIVEENGMTRTR